MSVEIAYRMGRLRAQAQHERLATDAARRSTARLWLGRALVTFGRFVEGGGAGKPDYGSPSRA